MKRAFAIDCRPVEFAVSSGGKPWNRGLYTDDNTGTAMGEKPVTVSGRRKGMMFLKKKKQEQAEYDRDNWKPVLRCSICNGEQVAGFKDRETGKFHEAAFIRNEKELKEFMEIYGIEKITKEY